MAVGLPTGPLPKGMSSLDEGTQWASQLLEAAKAIQNADALLIASGAGMGVDSGLPDFRGAEGFWKAYPPFRGRKFSELSTPHWFRTDPELAWGFFGHRLNLYRSAVPHAGFSLLRKWGENRPGGYFVFTSNVDGQFQKAGFPADRILECHGSIHHLQCERNCGKGIWSSTKVFVEVDESTIRSKSQPPQCPVCGSIARPNILMFGDWDWDSARTDRQYESYNKWLRENLGKNTVSIELGAGIAVPTVRKEAEQRGNVLIRINPNEAHTSPGGISLPMGALKALENLGELLDGPLSSDP